MPTVTIMNNNYATMRVEGTVTLSSSGTVSSYKGDGITVAKNGTGLYDVTWANPAEMVLHENLGAGAHLVDAAIGTVKDVGVKAQWSQSTTTGDLTMTIRTVDAAGADVDEATDGLTVAFYGVFRYARMTNPFD